MKVAAILAPGIVAVLLMALIALALSNEPPPIGPVLAALSTNLVVKPSTMPQFVYLDKSPQDSQSLEPGVYQTRPEAIILIVPERGLDERCVAQRPGPGFKMPVVKPPLQAVPKTPRP